jgi:hypothetical protein
MTGAYAVFNGSWTLALYINNPTEVTYLLSTAYGQIALNWGDYFNPSSWGTEIALPSGGSIMWWNGSYSGQTITNPLSGNTYNVLNPSGIQTPGSAIVALGHC